MNINEFNQIYKEHLSKILSDKELFNSFIRTVANNYKYDFKTNVMINKYFPNSSKFATKEFWNKIDCKIKESETGVPIINSNNEIDTLYNIHQVLDNKTNKIPNKFNLFDFELKRDYLALFEYSKNLEIQLKDRYSNMNEVIKNIAINFFYSNIFEELDEKEQDFYINLSEHILLKKLTVNLDKIDINSINLDDINKTEYIISNIVDKMKYEIQYIINYIKEFNLNEIKTKDNIKNIEKNNNIKLKESLDIEIKISEKNINDFLIKGSPFSEGKYRIYDFFNKENDKNERTKFLSKEYGIGGWSTPNRGNFIDRVFYDTKGISLTKRNGSLEDTIILKWNEVENLIYTLIKEKKYLSKDEYLKIQENSSNTQIQKEKDIQKNNSFNNIDTSTDIKDDNTFKEDTTNDNLKIQVLQNYKIISQEESLTPSQRLENNINAIKTLKLLEKENRNATQDEQEILSKYVGWGGLSEVFNENKSGQWEVARNYLSENLTSQEYSNAIESTLTSFYTPKIVIESIYKTLEKFNFKGGNILEPSCGVGNFIGNIPDNLSNKSKFYAIELDTLSGNIAKKLYPQSNIQIKGFENTSFSNNFFDLAIGNVPFGEFKVNDAAYNKHNFLIHDYFFAKSIDKVRSGGVIAFITSSGTLDKKDDKVRKYIGSRCELLGAIRLPNTTFKGIAGTEVMSDIIFLKKKDNIRETSYDWYSLDTDANGLTYNKYFVDNPEQIVGKIKEISGRFGMVLSCELNEGEIFEDRLNKAIENINGHIDEVEIDLDDNIEKEKIQTLPAIDNVKNFSYTLIDDNIYYRENSIMILEKYNEKDTQKIKDYIELSNCLREVIRLQKEDYTDEEIKISQQKLNAVYDDFNKKYDYLNSKLNNRLLRKDSNYPLISSIEKLEEGKFKEKGDIFFKRTISKAKVVESVDTSQEALIVSISEKGIVDLDYMQKLSNISKDEIIQDLKGQIYLNINKFDSINNLYPFDNIYKNNSFNYVTQDEYLSGNIRQKIAILDQYISYMNNSLTIEQNPNTDKINVELRELNFQKEMLNKVMPKSLTASEISIRIGATWIPTDDYNDFIYEILKTPSSLQDVIKVEYSSFNSQYFITNKSRDKFNSLATMSFGTQLADAYKIIEDSLNLRDTKVYDAIVSKNGKKTYVLNKKETMIASQKQEIIKEKFKNWIFKDSDRRYRIEQLYNELFNSTVNREFDGSHLSLSGINTDIKLREHQKNAIARTLYGGNTLLAHVVGAGKTFEMVASAMESKRLGICSKSLFVVPNHLTEQIGREFMRLYPSANILVATKRDFEPKNRKKFTGKIATGEYDAVIIGHSQFEKIPMSKEYRQEHVKKQIDTIVNYIQDIKRQNSNDNYTVKQLEIIKKKLDNRLLILLNDTKKDNVINFEELGIDRIYVDEAHNYKNLYLYTKMRNVAGIGQTEALKSSDMFMKCRYLDETNGKGVIFATGTPVSNSMSELYTMQRYLQYDTLERNGLHNFDAWASTFGETVSSIELSPEGTGYRTKTRFSKFYNLPELMSMFKEIADIKTADTLNLPTPIAHYKTIVTKPTDEQKNILLSFSDRAEAVRNKVVQPNQDNMLKITNDGKKLALDQRLIDPLLPDDENSKINICIKNIFDIWEKTSKDKLTQLVFSDMSAPNTKKAKIFNIYDDIRNKLLKMGVPENEIEFIHNANTEKQKDELFAKVRKGEVRILLGSTPKMGAGTNVQNKLIALHDLDVPWRPSDLEQRAGRIVRQGNENKEVFIYRYVTENTFDAYLWQTIENKQKFISQIMTSKTPVRVMEDIDESTLSYSEIKALATANPLIKEKMDLDISVSKLKMLEANYKSNLYSLQDKILKEYPEKISIYEKRIINIQKDINQIEPLKNSDDKFTSINILGINYTDKKLGAENLINAIKSIKLGDSAKIIGNYRNLDIEVSYNYFEYTYKYKLKALEKYEGSFGLDPIGNITRMDNTIEKIKNILEQNINNLEKTKQQLEIAKAEVEKPFEKEEELKQKVLRLSEVNKLIELKENENTTESKEDKETTIYPVNSVENNNFSTISENPTDYELSL